jgi:uncharacterized protein
MMATEYLWRSLDNPGFEHVRVDRSHPGWDVYDSMLVREHEASLHRGGYTLIVDPSFQTLELRIMAEQEPGSMGALHLLATGDGVWTDQDERRIPELDGVIDVDIQWSPLTNTLPVRRLHLAPGEETSISVAYIELPSLSLRRVEQRYTRIDDVTVRYSSPIRDVVRDLALDEEGFVLEYPDLFTRMFPR